MSEKPTTKTSAEVEPQQSATETYADRPDLEPLVAWMTDKHGPPKDLGAMGIGWHLGFAEETKSFWAADFEEDERPTLHEEACIAYDVRAGEFVASIRTVETPDLTDTESHSRFASVNQARHWLRDQAKRRNLGPSSFVANAEEAARDAVRKVILADPTAWLSNIPADTSDVAWESGMIQESVAVLAAERTDSEAVEGAPVPLVEVSVDDGRADCVISLSDSVWSYRLEAGGATSSEQMFAEGFFEGASGLWRRLSTLAADTDDSGAPTLGALAVREAMKQAAELAPGLPLAASATPAG